MVQPICTTNKFGTVEYRLNGKLHREDGPAYIHSNGTQVWMQYGLYHRDDGGPALINATGIQCWYHHGECHREDGPAVIQPDGTEEYWLDDKQVDIMVHFLQRK